METKDELFEAAAVIPCVSTLSAAGLNVVLVRASVVDADEGCNVLVNVLAFLLVATEEILAVEQGVAAETKVTADFVDDAVNVVIWCDVQSPRLPQHCSLQVESGAERALARCRCPYIIHHLGQGDVFHSACPPIGKGQQVKFPQAPGE